MNIPQTIKIGGKVYRVEITDNLTLGKANVSAEIDFAECKGQNGSGFSSRNCSRHP